ncbi:MAG TPA: hypothetical protein VMU72_11015 [Gaiellaceae bacterium]|nr:hypothetical protein [Gaiellaceae bacterium]
MDVLSKLSRETQVVLGGGVLLLILSFLDWQQASFSFGTVGGTVGLNEWHGIGFLAALLVIAMLVWEVLRLMAVNVSAGTLSPGLVSVGLALLMALFTVIAFLNKGTARHWPAWIALIVALVVAAAAVMRARVEGVQMPQARPAASAGSAEPAGSAGPTDPPDIPSE